MTHLRVIVGIAACFVVAAVLGWRTFAQSLPKKEQLKVIQGAVREVATATRYSKYGSSSYPVVRIEGRIGAYSYLDWFPEPSRLYDELKPGDRVLLLSDTPDGNHWIWHIEKEGRVIVSYDEILAAVRANKRYDPYLVIGLGIAGAIGLYSYVRFLKRVPHGSTATSQKLADV